MSSNIVASTIGMLLMGLLAAACATKPPEPVDLRQVQTLSAKVEAVDLERRLVALRAANGRAATVEVGPNVRNLSEVNPGDHVVVDYYNALAAQLRTKDERALIDGVDVGLVDGAVGRKLTTTVVIDAVDRSVNTVSFRGTDGMLRTLAVQTPSGRRFIRQLRKGDEVEVTFTEALAIRFEST